MSGSLGDEVAAVEAALAELAFAIPATLVAARDLLSGPPTIAITGPANPDRDRFAAALRAQGGDDRCVVELPLDTVATAVWDALIVVTPADQALGRDEIDVVRAARAHGLPVLVVVSRLRVFGDAAGVAAGQEELRHYRLEPVLRPLGVGWQFAGEDAGRSAVSELARLLPPDPHRRPVRVALATVVDTVLAELAPRAERRDQENAALASMEAVLGTALVRIADLARTTPLTVTERLRKSRHNLDLAAVELAHAVQTGGDTSAAAETVRREFADLVSAADNALPEAEQWLATELDRVCEPLLRTATELEIELPPPVPGSGDWRTEDMRAATASLAAISLEGVLGELAPPVGQSAAAPAQPSTLRKLVELRRRHTRPVPPGDVERIDRELYDALTETFGRGARAPARPGADHARAMGAAQKWVSELGETLSVAESPRAKIIGGMDTLLRPVLRPLFEALATAAETGATARTRQTATDLRALVERTRMTLADRHAWVAVTARLGDLRRRW